jgi:ADP-heptose:LPS heptosyltransferase
LSVPKHILAIRFSALGDVAMAVPVIKAVLEQHPEIKITVVSNHFVEPLFKEIERCNFIPAFLHDHHKGFIGMIKLFTEIRRKEKIDFVIDLHDVLRSKILRTLLRFSGIRSAHIDKGRKEKKQLTRKKNKILRPLKTTHRRYADVFNKAGIPLLLDNRDPVLSKKNLPSSLLSKIIPGRKLIGVAPFSKHKEKMYPLSRMKSIIKKISEEENVQALFFGSKNEAVILEEWQSSIPGSLNVAGNYSFGEELSIISNLYAMISMDSANVHLASLYDVPVISVWGATHPFAGFIGWNQPSDNIVETDLYCRPCSVFGNKPCYRGDHACMENMPEEMILKKIKSLI